MTDLRKTTRDLRSTLKAAVRRVLTLAGGGESVQYATRVKAPALSRYGSTHEEHIDSHCPIDVAMDLDLEAGQPIILSAMAKGQGFELHPIASAIHSAMPWCAKIGVISRQSGQLHGLIGDALADGQIDANEAKCIVEEIDQHVEHLRRLRARVEVEGSQGGAVVRMVGEPRR